MKTSYRWDAAAEEKAMRHWRRPRLMGSFGKAAAITCLAATAAFYGGGAMLGAEVLGNYAAAKDARREDVAALVLKHDVEKGPVGWGEEAALCGISLATGFTAIAAGKKHRRDTAAWEAAQHSGGSSYSGAYDGGYDGGGGFWNGYWLGSSGSSRSSSSSSSNNGAALLTGVVIVGLVAAASATGVVSYKAMKANFGS